MPFTASLPHNPLVETPEFFVEAEDEAPPPPPPARERVRPARAPEGIWGRGDQVTWVAGLVLAVSSFTGWYAGSGVGVTLAVIGWHTGVLGKLVFFIGLAVIAVVALRESGVQLPAAAPESLVVLVLGALATVFVLIRVISIPESVLPAGGRGIGLWISLAASIAVILGGLLLASEEI